MRSGLRLLLDAEMDFELLRRPAMSYRRFKPCAGTGASGYVLKHAAGTEVVRSIRAAAAGAVDACARRDRS